MNFFQQKLTKHNQFLPFYWTPELLQNVFSFLPFVDFVNAIHVNQKWRRIGNTDYQWGLRMVGYTPTLLYFLMPSSQISHSNSTHRFLDQDETIPLLDNNPSHFTYSNSNHTWKQYKKQWFQNQTMRESCLDYIKLKSLNTDREVFEFRDVIRHACSLLSTIQPAEPSLDEKAEMIKWRAATNFFFRAPSVALILWELLIAFSGASLFIDHVIPFNFVFFLNFSLPMYLILSITMILTSYFVQFVRFLLIFIIVPFELFGASLIISVCLWGSFTELPQSSQSYYTVVFVPFHLACIISGVAYLISSQMLREHHKYIVLSPTTMLLFFGSVQISTLLISLKLDGVDAIPWFSAVVCLLSGTVLGTCKDTVFAITALAFQPCRSDPQEETRSLGIQGGDTLLKLMVTFLPLITLILLTITTSMDSTPIPLWVCLIPWQIEMLLIIISVYFTGFISWMFPRSPYPCNQTHLEFIRDQRGISHYILIEENQEFSEQNRLDLDIQQRKAWKKQILQNGYLFIHIDQMHYLMKGKILLFF
eukprot:gb/GECH01010702.1/.p1 GENE.gb/GECH01010702.1/~~gb/GECH01010702.1/.p1  ORF type:complete len:534 (+),score=43.24 gb/GECH01010702.1/:1-1602(+)